MTGCGPWSARAAAVLPTLWVLGCSGARRGGPELGVGVFQVQHQRDPGEAQAGFAGARRTGPCGRSVLTARPLTANQHAAGTPAAPDRRQQQLLTRPFHIRTRPASRHTARCPPRAALANDAGPCRARPSRSRRCRRRTPSPGPESSARGGWPIRQSCTPAVHYLHSKDLDPYPFILLNLLFWTQAAYATPLILLSQNRTAGNGTASRPNTTSTSTCWRCGPWRSCSPTCTIPTLNTAA